MRKALLDVLDKNYTRCCWHGQAWWSWPTASFSSGSQYVQEDQNIENSPSIFDVDNLLDELASTSGYSVFSLHFNNPTPRTPQTILRQLYRLLSPSDAAFVTQIILKDLRPLLHPLPSQHYTSALTSYNSNSIQPLSIQDAMRVWDISGRLLRAYRLNPVIDNVTLAFDKSTNLLETVSNIGSFIQVNTS